MISIILLAHKTIICFASPNFFSLKNSRDFAFWEFDTIGKLTSLRVDSTNTNHCIELSLHVG